jgi:hypothetical protein
MKSTILAFRGIKSVNGSKQSNNIAPADNGGTRRMMVDIKRYNASENAFLGLSDQP